MLIRFPFFEKLQFPQIDLRILFFLLFCQESSAGEFWSSNPYKLSHVRQFAAKNQCNRHGSGGIKHLKIKEPRTRSPNATVKLMKKQYTLFWISFAVAFRLLVLGSLYFGWLDLFSRDPTFTTSRIFVHGFCS